MHFLRKHCLYTSFTTSLSDWCWCKCCWSVYVVVLFWVTRLVLVSPLLPRHHSHHMITPCWSLGLHWQSLHINDHEHITTLQHYITSLHNSVNTLEECNRMPESNEPQIFISPQNQFPLMSQFLPDVLTVTLTQLTYFYVACWGNWFPSLHSPAAGPSPNFF